MNSLALSALQSSSRIVFPRRVLPHRCLSVSTRVPDQSIARFARNRTLLRTDASVWSTRRSITHSNRNYCAQAAPAVAADDGKKSTKHESKSEKPTTVDDGQHSQAERYLRYLQMDMAAEEDDNEQRVKLVPRKDSEGAEKKSLGRRAKDGVIHIYHGFRLFFLETRVATRLGWRKLRGNRLTRNEQRQFERTMGDVLRMVPFSLFIIIPMAELLLPFALYFFPNMLPTAFQDSKETRRRTQVELESKIQFAQFLQRTLEDIPLETTNTTVKTAEFKRFMQRIHEEGGYVSKNDLLKWMPFFAEHMTLDVLSVSQLRALCRLLQVRIMPFSTPSSLRLQLKVKIYNLRLDDKAIMLEGGVDSLTVGRLQEACRERGMRALGMSEQRLKQQLQQWMELSQNEKVPEAFLLLSRAFYFPEEVQYVDRLKSILTTLPDTVKKEAELRLTQLEGKKDYKSRRELILAIEQELKADRQAHKEAQLAAEADKLRAAEKSEQDEKAAEVQAAHERMVPLQVTTKSIKDTAKEIAMFADRAHDIAVQLDEEDRDPEESKPIAKEDLDAVGAILLQVAAVREAKEDVQDLRKDADEHAAEVLSASETARKQGVDVRQTALGRRLTAKVDTIVERLNKLVEQVDNSATGEAIDFTVGEAKRVLAAAATTMTVDELLEAISKTRKNVDGMTSVMEVLSAFDDDGDGVIDVDMALDVIQLIGGEDVKLDTKQVTDLVILVKREAELHLRMQQEAAARSDKTQVEALAVEEIPVKDSLKKSVAIRVDSFIPPAPMTGTTKRKPHADNSK